MKKFTAICLVLAMVLCFAAAVYAQGETPDNPLVFSYEDMDASVYDGKWLSTGLGFDVYVPMDWVQVLPTDEQSAAGLAYLVGEDGGGANLTVTLTETPSGYSYEQLGQELASSMTAAAYADLNGIQAVVFDNNDTKISGFSTLLDGTLITGVISAPTDDQYDAYSPYIKNIIMSVSPTEKPILRWENYESSVAEIDPNGRFVNFDEVDVKVWVTSLLEQTELTDELRETGYIGWFEDANQEVFMGVTYINYEGSSLEDYADLIASMDGYSEAEYCLLNGLAAITYQDDETVYVSIPTDTGYILEFAFGPTSDEGFYSLAQLMTASIQPK